MTGAVTARARLDPRALAALRPVLSVAIAVSAAHAMGLHDAWWAAISAFMVMQSDFGASVYRGVLRVVGTLCGAGIGFAVGPAIGGHPVVFVLLMFVAAWAGLFAALVFKHGYAWVLTLVTFVMVVCEALVMRSALTDFTLERVANIVLGSVACVVVAGLTDRRVIAALRARVTRAPPASSSALPAGASSNAAVAEGVRRLAALHALQGAVAVALLSVIVSLHELPSFPQAMVTTIAVLIVPLEAVAGGARATVMQRMAQRFAGCLLAGAVAFALLPFIGGRPFWCQAALCVGVWAGAWLQGGPEKVRYMAVQFSVAFLMVFVQDRGWTVDSGPALHRLGGVFAGIAALSVVLVIFRWIGKESLRRDQQLP